MYSLCQNHFFLSKPLNSVWYFSTLAYDFLGILVSHTSKFVNSESNWPTSSGLLLNSGLSGAGIVLANIYSLLITDNQGWARTSSTSPLLPSLVFGSLSISLRIKSLHSSDIAIPYFYDSCAVGNQSLPFMIASYIFL